MMDDDCSGNGGNDDSDGSGGNDAPPDPAPAADKQTNLTDPDSALMRKSTRHEYRQAYNGQAIVDADGSQLVLATNVLSTSNDREGFEGLIDRLCETVGKPETLLADAGYAGEAIIDALEKRDIEPLIAVARQSVARPYDFRPMRKPDKPRGKIATPWRLAMIEKLQTDEAKNKYKKRKSTVEPIFGIIKSVIGFTRFHLRSLEKVKLEWNLVTLAYNCKRLCKMIAV